MGHLQEEKNLPETLSTLTLLVSHFLSPPTIFIIQPSIVDYTRSQFTLLQLHFPSLTSFLTLTMILILFFSSYCHMSLLCSLTSPHCSQFLSTQQLCLLYYISIFIPVTPLSSKLQICPNEQ